jgi:predicted ferric reductase
MAEYKKGLWGKGYLDVTDEVRQVRRDEKFREDMGRIGQNFDNDMAAGMRNGVVGTAALGVGAVAVGVAATKNLRFRYKLQAFLHFPFALIVSFVVLNTITVMVGQVFGVSEEAGVTAVFVCMGLAVPVSIVWSIICIQKRTKPKLRRLGY